MQFSPLLTIALLALPLVGLWPEEASARHHGGRAAAHGTGKAHRAASHRMSLHAKTGRVVLIPHGVTVRQGGVVNASPLSAIAPVAPIAIPTTPAIVVKRHVPAARFIRVDGATTLSPLSAIAPVMPIGQPSSSPPPAVLSETGSRTSVIRPGEFPPDRFSVEQVAGVTIIRPR